jgi:hypothetical protein
MRLRAGIGSMVIAGCLCACPSPQAATPTPSTRTIAVEVQRVLRSGNAKLKSYPLSAITVSVPSGPSDSGNPIPTPTAERATLRSVANQLSALRYPAAIQPDATAAVTSMRHLAGSQWLQNAPSGAATVASIREGVAVAETAMKDLGRLLHILSLPLSLAHVIAGGVSS